MSAPGAGSTTPASAPATVAPTASGPALVAVLMGSESDRPIMDETTKILNGLGIAHEVHVMSAHRTPERVREFSRTATQRGIEVIIAGAGGAAHLPGVIAAQTILPIIGVPIPGSSMMGLDSLLSIVQMPGGVPVATVATGNAGARNAAYLAAGILSLAHPDVRERYRKFRVDQSGGELA
jgi:5-(carboxyamino)imidazole ribonucleotide mutase